MPDAPPDQGIAAAKPVETRYVVIGEASAAARPAGGGAERFWQLLGQAVLAILPLCFAAFFVLLVVHELRRGAVEVTRIEVPAKLQEAGLTPEVVARRLVDALDRAGDAVQAETERRRMAQLAGATPDFSVPVAGISMRSLAELVRDLLGLPKIEISGEIVIVEEKLALRLRLHRRGEVVSLSGFPPERVDMLLDAAAPGLWRVLQPQVYAWYIAETLPDQDEVIRRLAELRADAEAGEAVRDVAAYLTGQALLRDGRAEEALGLFQALMHDRPGYPQGAYGAAAALAALDRGEAAQAAHAEAVRRHGHSAWSHLSAGRLMLELDRPQPALAEAEAGLQADPAQPDLLLLRVAALAALGEAQEALRAARAWRARRPDFAAAHLAEGLALRAAEAPAEAAAACRRALALAPPGPGIVRGEAAYCLARTLGAAESAEALALLEAAATASRRVAPGLAVRALILRGTALAQAGEAAAALAAFESALVLRPNRAAALRGRAQALEALQRPDEAMTTWRRLAALGAPGDGAAAEGSSEAMAALERLRAAPR